jgi:hypothetical protein
MGQKAAGRPAARQGRRWAHFQTFEANTELLIETSSAGHVEVSFVVHFEFSSVNLDRLGNVMEQLFAHRWREHPDIRARPQETGVA